MKVTNQASIGSVSQRRQICNNCPSKEFAKDPPLCLITGVKVSELVRLKDNKCPQEHW